MNFGIRSVPRVAPGRTWDLTNLPRFMRMVQSLTVKDDRRSHWVIQIPDGAPLEWDAEITLEKP